MREAKSVRFKSRPMQPKKAPLGSFIDRANATTGLPSVDIYTGVIMTFTFYGTITNLIIANTTFDETMTISRAGQFYAGEQLVIDTRPGKKSIVHQAGGKSAFITGVLAPGSEWVQLHPGVNTIALQYAGGSEDLGLSIEYESLYRGI